MANQTTDNLDTVGAAQGSFADRQRSIPTRTERQAARAAVLVPLFFSTLCCVIELWAAFNQTPLKGMGIIPYIIQIASAFIDTLIGYFAATLISTIVYLWLQQYYYGCFSGLDHEKVISPLGIVFVVYSVAFLIYVYDKGTFLKLFMLFWTPVTGVTVWLSLRDDVQKIEQEVMSNSHDPNTFVSNGAAGCNPKQ